MMVRDVLFIRVSNPRSRAATREQSSGFACQFPIFWVIFAEKNELRHAKIKKQIMQQSVEGGSSGNLCSSGNILFCVLRTVMCSFAVLYHPCFYMIQR